MYPRPPHQYSDFSEIGLNDKKTNKSVQRKHSPLRQNGIFRDKGSSSAPELHHNDDDNDYTDCQSYVYLMNGVVFQMELENGSIATADDIVETVIANEELNLPESSRNVFSLWMCSNLLELQLKPHHRLLSIQAKWESLLSRYSHASLSRQQRDEPFLSFQRNVFFPLAEEQKLLDGKVIELLYEEAKYNVLEGRYPCDLPQYIILGGIQARLDLGPYDPQLHSTSFFGNHKSDFLPYHLCHNTISSWFHLRSKHSPEVKLLESYKCIPCTASDRKLQRRYLEICWSLPYYGCAFFQAQIEEPVKGLVSFFMHEDRPVLVGINERGVYVVDNIRSKLLIGLKYEEFSWELTTPCRKDNPDCLPCLFVQFVLYENGIRVSKLLQVFSKQALFMDLLITAFVNQIKNKANLQSVDEVDLRANFRHHQSPCEHHQELRISKLPNRLNKLTLATFDEQDCSRTEDTSDRTKLVN